MYPYVLRDTSRDNFPQLSASRLAADGCLCPQPLLGGDFFGGFPLQLSFDLPATPEHALENLLVQGLSDASSGIETGPFDGALWAHVLVLVLCLLLSTPRDIKRYLAALPAGLRMIGEEVALVDVLALEAIRLRLPEVFAMLGPMSHALTDVGMITSQAPGWQAVGRSGARGLLRARSRAGCRRRAG